MPPSHRSGRAARETEPLRDHLVISCYIPPSIGKLNAVTQGSNDGWLELGGYGGDEPAGTAPEI
jgi:hypothetical protein